MRIFKISKNKNQFISSTKEISRKAKKLSLFMLLFSFAFVACNKDNDNIDDNPEYDHSLILSRASGARLVLTNPVNGKDLYLNKPVPAVEDVKSLKAGYLCKNAVFIAKTYLKEYTMSLYTCDAKTATNVKAITSDDLYVFEGIDVSRTSPKIVFTGKPNDTAQYKSVYTINEDGSNLMHISEPLELVNGQDGILYELQPTNFPAFSPNGSKIAFDALGLDHPNHNTFYEFILTMNTDGSSKEVIFSDLGQQTTFYDLCWTQNGNFLLFIMMKADDNFHRWVKALNIETQEITDITSSLEINGDQVYHISSSPNSDKFVFNQHLGGGSELFIAEYEINNNTLTIKGTPTKLTNKVSSGYSYYTPSWQLWDEEDAQ